MAFTLLGSVILWLAYPAGLFLSLSIAEASCHVLRYLSSRHLVFPRGHGCHVSVSGYIVTAITTTLTGIVAVAMFRNLLKRTTPYLLVTLLSVSVGFLGRRFVYKLTRIYSPEG